MKTLTESEFYFTLHRHNDSNKIKGSKFTILNNVKILLPKFLLARGKDRYNEVLRSNRLTFSVSVELSRKTAITN